MPRIARPCYDKYHRCPGWAGPGTKYNRRGHDWCENGYVHYNPERWAWRFRVHRCSACRTFVLPYHVRWLDWCWWRWIIRDLPRRWEDIW